MSGVIGVLAAMSLFLWFSAYIEARHLGPVAARDRPATGMERTEASVPALAEAPVIIDPVTSAA